jgi:hypothetical protein
MEQVIAGIVGTIIVQIARRWGADKKVQNIAKAIVEDKSNPINDPHEAIVQATIIANAERYRRAGDKLGRRLQAAELRAERTREDEAADPHDVEIIERDGTEKFK